MRRFNDSRLFPFQGLFWLDQLDRLLDLDRDFLRKELAPVKECKCGKDCKCEKDRKCEEENNYLRVADGDEWNKTIQFYSPRFELGEDGVYTYTTTISKDVKPKDIVIDAIAGHFYLQYGVKTENSEWSAASSDTLPDDLDVETMKAVLKNGVLTITAKQVVKEEPKVEEEDEVEYEIEIGK